MTVRFAALPMYDPPELHAANDALWRAIADRLAAGGLSDVPWELTREDDLRALWRREGLLLGQTCGYPLMKGLSGPVQLVTTPIYRAEGCENAFHRSSIIVAASSPIERLDQLKGSRCAINGWDSNSGMNLLRALVAPLAVAGRFFGSVTISGSHRRSLAWVAEGSADMAAVDCVTLALLRRLAPRLTAGVRVLGWTDPSPALPFITGAATDETTLKLLRSALQDIATDPATADIRDALLIDGFRTLPLASYDEVLRLELAAAEQGYPKVA